MTANWEITENGYGVLTFEISEPQKKVAIDKAFNKVKKNLNVPGFRKGKVTRSVFNRMFGETSLYEDALNNVLPVAYPLAVEEAGIDPVAQPEISVESLNNDEPWVIKAKVAVKPVVKLGQFEGLEVEKQDRSVTDEEVEDRLKAEQEKNAELIVKEADQPAEYGDTVVIDYKGFVDGVAFEGGEDKNHSLELGSNQFIPGFEEQLIGTKEGDEVEVKVTFPSEYHSEALAGKEATFEVKVHEVKTKELPELDDEFAKDVSEDVSTLGELKEKYRKELEDEKKQLADEKVQDAAIRKAIDNAEIIDLPEVMVTEEVDRQLDHYLNNMRRQGIEPDLYYQITGSTEDDLKQQFTQDADVRTKTNLILEQIVKEKDIEVSEGEIESEIKSLADEYDMDEKQVRNTVSTDMLAEDIKLKKALGLITESVKEV
ncbi:MAG TPA: trigger factor [Bavariicoccus seileri]|uniref:Trigger factor n=1 Tax=Bavariicoccus seileri TaxID=549685 RepID=A0A3D4S6D6_9ENTE|nr:trigger factor [Bavariicoccus seileri]HCS94042.1 trigger factor [Bavariicoccus seileri]